MGGAVIVYGAECQDKRRGNVARRSAESVNTTTRQCNKPQNAESAHAQQIYMQQRYIHQWNDHKNAEQEAESIEKKQEVCADINGRKEKE